MAPRSMETWPRNRDKSKLAGCLTQAYMVFRSGGKEDSKHSGATGKFLGKSGRPPGTSNQTNSISLQQGNFTDESDGATVRGSLSTVLLDLHPFLGQIFFPCPSIPYHSDETNFSSLINQRSDLICVLNTLRLLIYRTHLEGGFQRSR